MQSSASIKGLRGRAIGCPAASICWIGHDLAEDTSCDRHEEFFEHRACIERAVRDPVMRMFKSLVQARPLHHIAIVGFDRGLPLISGISGPRFMTMHSGEMQAHGGFLGHGHAGLVVNQMRSSAHWTSCNVFPGAIFEANTIGVATTRSYTSRF